MAGGQSRVTGREITSSKPSFELACILRSERSLRDHQWLLWFSLGLSLKGPRQLGSCPLKTAHNPGLQFRDMLLGREAQQKGTCELLSKARISSRSESIIKSNSLAQL